MISYTAHVADSAGTRLATFANFIESGAGAALEYVLSVGKVGVLTMTLPSTVDTSLLPLDGRIGIWRSINGAPPSLDGDAVFLIRRWDMGTDYTTITAVHANELFMRRIVAYNTSNLTWAYGSGPADDVLKYFADSNMANVQLSRTGALPSDQRPYLTIQANLSQGYSLSKAASWRNLMDIVQELGEASTSNSIYLTAEIVAPTETTLELRTYATMRGVDHRASSTSPVVFSEVRGNLKNAVLTNDRLAEVTHVLAGGAGEGAARLIAEATSTRAYASVFNWRELFVDASNIADTAQLQAAADAALWAGRPISLLTADLVETPGCTRGIHFNLGDMVTIEHRGYTIDVRLDLIHEVVTPTERRSEIRVQAVLPT